METQIAKNSVGQLLKSNVVPNWTNGAGKSTNTVRTVYYVGKIRGIEMYNDELRSPHIRRLSWGRMEVDGVGVGKDFKLWPGGGREWDWRETGTHHVPGIQPADIKELLEKDSQTIILSRGILLMLHTCQDTLDLLEEKHIAVHVAETKAAAEIYNDLASRGNYVGGLFHSTC